MTPPTVTLPNGKTFTVVGSRPTAWKEANGSHRVIATPLDGNAAARGALELTRVPPSLNNAFLNTKKGRTKSPAYRQWIASAQRDLRRQSGWHVPGRIVVRLFFRKGETRADLDNLIKPCLDLLVSAGRIADDRNVVDVRALFGNDLKGVRIEIEAHGLEAKGPAPAAEHKQPSSNAEAAHFRAQKSTSTDPDYLERMARSAEARSA